MIRRLAADRLTIDETEFLVYTTDWVDTAESYRPQSIRCRERQGSPPRAGPNPHDFFEARGYVQKGVADHSPGAKTLKPPWFRAGIRGYCARGGCRSGVPGRVSWPQTFACLGFPHAWFARPPPC